MKLDIFPLFFPKKFLLSNFTYYYNTRFIRVIEIRFPHSLVKLALYDLIKRHPVQASPLPSSPVAEPEVFVGYVGGQVVRRLEEIGYGDRLVGILERYGQRDEYLE